jgi:hypothetical protein
VVVVLLVFLGVSALPSGIVMLVAGTGVFPREWVDAVPIIDSLVVPALVLLLGFGAAPLVTAYGVLRRPAWRWMAAVERVWGYHWSWGATVLIGLGLVAWISMELIFLPAFSVLEPLYGAIGLALVLLPLEAGVRRYLGVGDED